MHHFDLFKRRRHCHDSHDRHHYKGYRKHVGKFCKKIGKRGHYFEDMLCSLGEKDVAPKNPQDPDLEEKMRLFVKEFFKKSFMERQAGMGNPTEKEAGEGTSREHIPQAGASNMERERCMFRGRGRRYGWKGCQYCQTAGRNISGKEAKDAIETKGKKSEEDTEDTPYCKHLYHHHQGYERRHRSYGHGKRQQGRSSGDESSSDDEKWTRRGRHHHDRYNHHDHHDHHRHHDREGHGCHHHWRMGWKDHGCDCFQGKTRQGSQEPNQEAGGNDMQVDPVSAPEVENLENEEKSQQEVQEVAETLRKSNLE